MAALADGTAANDAARVAITAVAIFQVLDMLISLSRLNHKTAGDARRGQGKLRAPGSGTTIVEALRKQFDLWGGNASD